MSSSTDPGEGQRRLGSTGYRSDVDIREGLVFMLLQSLDPPGIGLFGMLLGSRTGCAFSFFIRSLTLFSSLNRKSEALRAVLIPSSFSLG